MRPPNAEASPSTISRGKRPHRDTNDVLYLRSDLFVARRAICPSYDRSPLTPPRGSNDNLNWTSRFFIGFRFAFHEPCLFASQRGSCTCPVRNHSKGIYTIPRSASLGFSCDREWVIRKGRAGDRFKRICSWGVSLDAHALTSSLGSSFQECAEFPGFGSVMVAARKTWKGAYLQ
jgi:hypothetical protein